MSSVSENPLLRENSPDHLQNMTRALSQSGYESDSLSDMDSLTEDLDQIGKLSMPKWPTWSKEKLPSLANLYSFSSLPTLPNLPTFSNLGSLPQLPNLPDFPALPTIPNFPQFLNLSNQFSNFSASQSLPHFDLSEVSKYISQYVNNIKGQDGVTTPEAEVRLINSVKTALVTRIQMQTFLSDLRQGFSFQAAIDRLQPLTELVHEAITLPADDDDDDEMKDYDFEKSILNDTEPAGVEEIANSEQPIMNDIVVPDTDTLSDMRRPSSKKLRKQRKDMKRLLSAFSDDNESSMCNTGSDLDVDELTLEEARVLTHLESLDDFFKEDLLRKKIQRIQLHDGLSQNLKNKLVTKLMMGNYYKYINEKLLKEKGVKLQPCDQLTINVQKSEAYSNPIETATAIPNSSVITENYINELNEKSEDISSEEMDYAPSNAEDENEEEVEEEVVLTEKDTQPSYYDFRKKILGCPHYQRNCKVECPECFRWYTCRFCHDAEVVDHKLIRCEVKHILCMRCGIPQVPDTNYCVNCEEELANYFCRQCVLYDNDPAKDIYHCDKCGICRLGLGLSKDYFHCDTCNICLTIDLKDNHKCVTNTTHCNCPICNDYLFTSVNKVVFMKCGHLIHKSCYDEMIKHSYKCPICKKTVVNSETQFRILDQEIRQLLLPAPYNMWRCIVNCNDCNGKSNCAYHVLGLKCKYCHSYNTNQLRLIKPEEDDDKTEDGTSDNEESFREKIASMRLMKTNLSSNFVIDEKMNDTPTEYDGDVNENSDDEGMSNFVNFRSLTKSILGKNTVDGKSVAEAFQSFINSSIMDE